MAGRRGATREIEFDIDHLDAVLDEMTAITAVGRGWLNVVPIVADDVDVPPTPGPLAVFNSRGPAVPLGTWTPATGEGEPASLGVQHGSGTRALDRLADAGLALPRGWARLADHPRRGLVVRVADGTGPEIALDWLLAAMVGLGRLPLTGRWLALVYRR